MKAGNIIFSFLLTTQSSWAAAYDLHRPESRDTGYAHSSFIHEVL